ncbi:MAG: DUF1320 domain-containing protein [Pseudoflavonifractor sp.]|nr:DUF1320 domain-containing protein [Pseudoflavonifractor sp.]
MFLTDQDYEVVVGKPAMDVISRCSDTIRSNAEAEAQEEIAGYLRPDYDVTALFAAEYGARNPKMVMVAVDLALYHMAASLPQKMGMEIRKERYDAAVKWLEGVRAGRIVPDLPRPDDCGAGASGAGTIYISEHKLRHNW